MLLTQGLFARISCALFFHADIYSSMPAKQSTNESAFKNWINAQLLNDIAKSIKAVHPEFASTQFLKISNDLGPLELKARVRLVREKLRELLPADYPKALKILMASMNDGSLKGFGLWPYADFIENYGLDHPDLSLKALYELTSKFTGEFAVRPFIRKSQIETLAQLEKWATDKNYHVRRWVSEGTRPRLPWGLRLQALVKDPAPTIKLLEILKYDSELYVRKSVANHLNDISKDHPEMLVKLLGVWQKTVPPEHSEKINWISRHSLRSLLKAGHPGALALLGFGAKVKIQAKNLKLKSSKVRVGQYLEFSFDVICTQSSGKKPQLLMIDYIIHHRKAGGKLSPKVFKLKSLQLSMGEKIKIAKRHSFKPVTTRVYYSGEHFVEIQVNGQKLCKAKFDFKAV
jgi:3-methyladenine DNA glycosylase AlkC